VSSFQSSLEGKAGIVTGGTSGFGYAIVRALTKRDANLAVFSIDEPPADARAGIEGEKRGKAAFIKKDILATGASEVMVAETLRLYGRLDFVIANAGFAIRFERPLLETPLDEIEQSLATQFAVFPTAFTTLTLAAARVMAPRYGHLQPDSTGHRPDSGAVVVTLSEASLCPLRDDLLAYAAAKKATQWSMQSLAASLGPHNIRVNGIAPGFADTAGPRLFYDRHPAIREDVESKCHLKPAFMDPGAVVPAVLYLLTDNYITGVTIPLDGGYNIDMKRYFQ
jgi:NAD(P)-dependent dehydrogenase (short-subunit alcohol dehydrogenase family)